MGPVENEINDEIFENDENAGTAITDFVNDWEVSHKSTPNTKHSIFLYILNMKFLGLISLFTFLVTVL